MENNNSFDKRKVAILEKINTGFDRSKKGSIDEKIKNLIERINALDDFISTSSCSGRILLMRTENITYQKNLCDWIFVTHDYVKDDFEKLWKSVLDSVSEKCFVQLKVEPAILHVACRNLESAEKLLNVARRVGFKHSGIFSISKKIIVEIIGKDLFQMPIVSNNLILITKESMREIINLSNIKLSKNHDMINRLVKEIEEF
jgi:tRNA wybutosine-synthesizing protein 3